MNIELPEDLSGVKEVLVFEYSAAARVSPYCLLLKHHNTGWQCSVLAWSVASLVYLLLSIPRHKRQIQ